MIKLPKVFSLVLCERIQAQPAEGGISLMSVFQSFHLRRFPSRPQVFAIFVALFDGVGEGTMELAVERRETEQEIYFNRRWVMFPGRGYVVNYEIPVKRLIFPAPGSYDLKLRFDNKELTQRSVEVFRI